LFPSIALQYISKEDSLIQQLLSPKGNAMRAIKEARHFIEKYPEDDAAKILAKLVLALETEDGFVLAEIYRLDMDQFKLALKILQEWRLDRYYEGKARLFDSAMNVVAGLGQSN
jgi:hypothetical protein